MTHNNNDLVVVSWLTVSVVGISLLLLRVTHPFCESWCRDSSLRFSILTRETALLLTLRCGHLTRNIRGWVILPELADEVSKFGIRTALTRDESPPNGESVVPLSMSDVHVHGRIGWQHLIVTITLHPCPTILMFTCRVTLSRDITVVKRFQLCNLDNLLTWKCPLLTRGYLISCHAFVVYQSTPLCLIVLSVLLGLPDSFLTDRMSLYANSIQVRRAEFRSLVVLDWFE